MQEKYHTLNTFGQRLEFLRKAWGLSQDDLAKEMGLGTNGAISNYEKGLRTPDINKVVSLAAKMRVSIDWLLAGIFEPQREALKSLKGMFDDALISIDLSAKKLSIPPKYLEYIMEGRIYPDCLLYEDLCNIVGITIRNDDKNKKIRHFPCCTSAPQ